MHRFTLDGQRPRFFNPLTLLMLCAGAHAALYKQPWLLSMMESLLDPRARGMITPLMDALVVAAALRQRAAEGPAGLAVLPPAAAHTWW